MFNKTIVLTSPGTKLSIDCSHYTLRSHGRRVTRIPPAIVRQFVIYHGVEVTPKAMMSISESGTPMVLLNRSGRITARLNPPWRGTPEIRIEQVRSHLDSARRLLISKRLVDAKLANTAAVIARHASNYPDPALNAAAKKIKKIRFRAQKATSIPRLMGFEGLASRTYFSVFNRMLRVDWATFTGRNRRPPRDPVNSLLSYTYAVLNNEIQSLTEGTGLDPYIGFLHGISRSRANLSLDLIEPFRQALADRLCLRLINRGTLKPEHFEPDPINGQNKGIYLSREGRVAILEEVLTWASAADDELGKEFNSPRGLLTRTVDIFTDAAAKGDLLEFRPFYLIPTDANQCPDQEP